MAQSVFFIVLLIISIAATAGAAWRYNRRLIINERCRAQCPVTGGCILEPRTSDLLSMTTFREKIAGKVFNAIYRLEGPKIPARVLPFTGRLSYRLIFNSDTGNIFVNLRFRQKGAENCTVVPQVPFGTSISNTHAVFDLASFGFVPGGSNGRCYYVGNDLDEFVFVLCCFDRSSIRNGKCNGAFFIDVLLISPSLDRVPWKKLECSLRVLLGLKMTDDRNHFLFLGDDCLEII